MDDETRRVRVIDSQTHDRIQDITFESGDDIAVGHRNQQYPAFVWGATEDGRAGWVPESYLEMTGKAEAVANHDYHAAALTVAKGEIVDVLEVIGGWLYCRNADGVEGWVAEDITEDTTK